MKQSLFFFFVDDFIDAYHAMRSSLDEHESDEVITATFVSVNCSLEMPRLLQKIRMKTKTP